MKKLFTFIASLSVLLTGCMHYPEICENPSMGKCLYSKEKAENTLIRMTEDDDFAYIEDPSLPLEEKKMLNTYLMNMILISGFTKGDNPAKYTSEDSLENEASNIEFLLDNLDNEPNKLNILVSAEKLLDYAKRSSQVSKGFIFKEADKFVNHSLVFIERNGELFEFFSINEKKVIGYFPDVGKIAWGNINDLKWDKIYYFVPQHYKL